MSARRPSTALWVPVLIVGALAGTPVAAARDLPRFGPTQAGSGSANGPIAFTATGGASPANFDIYTMNPDGSLRTRLTSHPEIDTQPSFSGDGTRIAFSSHRDGNLEIYTMSRDGSDLRRLTDDPGADFAPTWSRDGTRIAFRSDRNGDGEIYTMDADGANEVNRTTSAGTDTAPSWSPDGRRIAFASSRTGNFEIFAIGSDGSSPVNLTNDPGLDSDPDWSPDGSRIAFRSERVGNREIYTMSAGGASQQNVTNDGAHDRDPAWSPDGSRIAFTRFVAGSGLRIHVLRLGVAGADALSAARSTDDFASWGPPVSVDGAPAFTRSPVFDPRRFSVARGSTPTTVAARRGSTLRYSLSEVARVRITIELATPGRRVGKRCLRAGRAALLRLPRRKRCTRYVREGALTRDGPPGANAVRFSGRINRRALRRGLYRARVRAVDLGGQSSGVKTAPFRIVR